MNIKDTQRLVFQKGKQKEFIKIVKEKSELSWKKLAEKIKKGESTLKYSYLNEKTTLPYSVYKNLCTIASLNPKIFLKFVREVKDENWGKRKGGKSGKKRIFGKIKINISLPQFSEDLAEFVGILIGDGSLSKLNYEITISLNSLYEMPYAIYIKSLINKLFRISPRIYIQKGTIRIRINSKALFNFLLQIGVPWGKKKKEIPKWIGKRKEYIIGFVRGLIDTDGSIFLSSDKCVLNFSSKELANETSKLLGMILGRYIRVLGNNLNIFSLNAIKDYMKKVGSSNLKNIIKFREYLKYRKTVKSQEIKKYMKDYMNCKLPYKWGSRLAT